MKSIILFIAFLLFTNIYGGDNKLNEVKCSNGICSIKNNLLELKIDSNNGGRITSFSLNGYEFIVQKEERYEAFGSTFWPSPQSLWNWPPIKTVDREAYSILESNSLIELKSKTDALTGCSFTKIIRDSKSDNSINMEFIITNETEKEISLSPWQITRAKKGGILFFPKGEGEQRMKYFPLAETEYIDNIIWYQTNLGESLDNHRLNINDGSEGWLAYAIDQKVFIKKYEDNKPDKFAVGEGEVIFYTSRNQDYIEIEIQGKYEKLTKGNSLSWDVEWFAFEIPTNIKIEVGNADLVNFVRGKILTK